MNQKTQKFIIIQKTYKKTILSDFNEDYKKKIGNEVARLMKEKRMNKRYFNFQGLPFAPLNSIIEGNRHYTFNSLLQCIEILEMTPMQFFKNIK